MAKSSDQRAGGFETENTGGVLSGLLADEEHLDRRAMFRLGTWGVASIGAVIIAVLANQTGMKLHHDEVAALDLARQSQQIQSVAKESQNETRRLASAIDTLNGDRDRMYSRLTTVEQGLDSVTGAIVKQTAVAPPAITPPAPAPVAQAAAPEPAPAVAPVTTSVAPVTASVAPVTMTPTASPATEKPRAEAKKPAPPAAATAAPPNPPAATSAEPLMASKSLMAPPDAAAPKPIEPEPSMKTAAATPPPARPEPAPMTGPSPTAPSQAVVSPAPEVPAPTQAAGKLAAAEPAPAPLAVKRTEFGVDVGGANSVVGLRALWRGLLKSRSNAPLVALQPIIVVKERDNGLGMQLRLVAGPLGDAAAAARICAKIAENGRPCETTVFDGQRLAMRAEDAPATTESIAAKPSAENKPSAERSTSEKSSDAASEKSGSDNSSAKPNLARQGSHRRGYSYSRRAPVEQAPQPPPQQPSTLSWFRRSQ